MGPSGARGAGGNSQEPVEQLPAEAQADGGIVDVEGKVLLRLEVQVREGQLQVCHLDPEGEGTERVRHTEGRKGWVQRGQAALTG